MPRPKGKIPSYRLHARTCQAVVTLDGKDRYLGKHDRPESREQYDRLIAEWLVAGRTTAGAADATELAGLMVTVVISAFMTHAKTYYKADGEPPPPPAPKPQPASVPAEPAPVLRLWPCQGAALKPVTSLALTLGFLRRLIGPRPGRRVFLRGPYCPCFQ